MVFLSIHLNQHGVLNIFHRLYKLQTYLVCCYIYAKICSTHIFHFHLQFFFFLWSFYALSQLYGYKHTYLSFLSFNKTSTKDIFLSNVENVVRSRLAATTRWCRRERMNKREGEWYFLKQIGYSIFHLVDFHFVFGLEDINLFS